MLYFVAFCSRLEVASDVVSGNFVGPILFDWQEKFSYHRTDRSSECPRSRLRRHFRRVFRDNIQPEVDSDVISGVGVNVHVKLSDSRSKRFSVRPFIPDTSVKFCYPCLNRSPENRPEAAGGEIFDRFSK